MAKLTPQEFYKTYAPYALKVQEKTGLNYLAILTQAALESGWGGQIIGTGNLFGVKDTDGVNGNEVLVTTQEVLNTPNYKFPVIVSIVKYGTKWVYTIRDYFRKYDTIEEGFIDHANFFVKNSNYKKAWEYRAEPETFLRLVADAGYATDPLYKDKVIGTLKWFQNYSRIIGK